MNIIEAYKDYRAVKPLLNFLERNPSMKSSLFSWKTTVAGLVTLGVPIAAHFGWLTMEQAGGILTLAVSFGLIAAKDASVTGGTKVDPNVKQ